jgi:SAM-dependent methyltransferase
VHTAEYTIADQQRMAKARNYFAWQGRLVTRELGRRVLEVGCGLGNFTGMLLDREEVVAVDFEPGCVELLRERYTEHRNVEAFVCDLSSPEFRDLARFRPDSCVCLNVLEHIEDDRTALESMASVVRPGGVIVLLVPAFQSLYGPIDRNLGHYRRYSRTAVAALARDTGLRVRKLHYSNIVGFFGWWMNSHFFKREAQSEGQIEVFDRYIVPVLSAAECVVRPPFGQSLLAVLEKNLGTDTTFPGFVDSPPQIRR